LGIRLATPRTRIIGLDLAGQNFPFQAGQAVMVGLHGSLLRKPYSIASAPVEAARSRCLELLVQVDDSGGLDPHLELAAAGTLLDVEGPFGTFGLVDHADKGGLLFVAGGTGIAPLRSMLIERVAADNPPPISVVYSARSVEELAYFGEIEDLAASSRIRAFLTVTRAVPGTWLGRLGRIDRRLLEVATIRTSPVMPRPAGLTRNAAVSPTSEDSIARRSGAFSLTTPRIDEKPPMPAAASVFTGPAEIAFTRMFCGPRSLARYLTELSSAAFATPITL
jgi:ferredoxin-NADP reductase